MSGINHKLEVDSYAYLPPNLEHSLKSDNSATLVVFERRSAYLENHMSELIVGSTDKQPLLETPGEVFELRKLLPTSLAYDFNIHEVHYNQHGLLILEGQGIYRLRNSWFPVEAGDAIWMAPFVPQWSCIVTKKFIQDCGRVKITTTLMVPWTFKAHDSTWEKILEIGLTVIVTERVIIATAAAVVAAGAPGKLEQEMASYLGAGPVSSVPTEKRTCRLEE